MMRKPVFWALCLFLTPFILRSQSAADSMEVPMPPVEEWVSPENIDIEAFVSDGAIQISILAEVSDGRMALVLNDEEVEVFMRGGRSAGSVPVEGGLLLVNWENGGEDRYRLFHCARMDDQGVRVRHIPLWLSIFPPLIAIGLALVFKEVTISLFAGVWSGAFIAGGMRVDSVHQFLMSFWGALDTYIIRALADPDHMAVLVFSLLIGGMVAVISRNGGMAGVVLKLSRFARSGRSAQFVTWLLGVAIFFDDYANTLIVGNTMRPVTDRFRISREKLAYIVDSTAAPVVSIAFVTTWIGAELGYIEDGIRQLSGFDFGMSPYALFLGSLKYSFYPVMTLFFILFLIRSGKDFGPMSRAERAALTSSRSEEADQADSDGHALEDLDPVEGAPMKWQYAALPILTVIAVTLYGLLETGMQGTWYQLRDAGLVSGGQSWSKVWAGCPLLDEGATGFFRKIGLLIGNSNSYTALLWASLSGLALALVMTVSTRIMTLFASMETMMRGFKSLMPAVLILALAWSLALTTEELHTATWLSSVVEGNLSAMVMPMVVFVLAALISFSTGSSWSTMAILYPIAIPTTWAVCQAQGLDGSHGLEIVLCVISVVLAASVLGDHCSPISDTTILSSLASSCNHISHVRTQMPYALTVGGVSLAATGISIFAGGGWLVCGLCHLGGLAILFFIVNAVGKRN